MDRLFYLDHGPIHFHFRQTPETFVVEEIPLYPFAGEGEHLILKVRKRNMTTWEMIQAISERVGVKVRDIGYAGLKDKNALTYQYISLPRRYSREVERFSHGGIKIVDQTYHTNKLRMGHLRGNRFFVRLKKVSPVDGKKIDEVLKVIGREGIPNYFGYQRFGVDGRNYLLGKEIVEGERRERRRELRRLYISAYQSHLFNLWLSKRVQYSKFLKAFKAEELTEILALPKGVVQELQDQPQFFKLFPGDLMEHYPSGRLFLADNVRAESLRFSAREIAPTGLLPGMRTKRAEDLARKIEKEFDDQRIEAFGGRRYAWVFGENMEGRYRESEAWYELNFFLPKGSYATVLLEEIAHRKLKE
ncbi:MAG: tRNA pseudouridine(13) synthase TruD [Epsilonproteobacteria bacterium]|nr:tRNA pseudouridine(13) synthase TruD [Campylobacterota bacterium]NPA56173.1 tRNA pseudouridine(13) synthase TruD [Campylobacterota bacterium]